MASASDAAAQVAPSAPEIPRNTPVSTGLALPSAIATMPLEEQPDAWGALDEKIGTEYFPSIVTAFRNDLYAFGERIGSPAGLASIGAPYYQNLYVVSE